MSTSLVRFVAQEEKLRDLPMPAAAYALLAVGAFVVLLAILWSFRNTAGKVRGGHPGDAHGRSEQGHR